MPLGIFEEIVLSFLSVVISVITAKCGVIGTLPIYYLPTTYLLPINYLSTN